MALCLPAPMCTPSEPVLFAPHCPAPRSVICTDEITPAESDFPRCSDKQLQAHTSQSRCSPRPTGSVLGETGRVGGAEEGVGISASAAGRAETTLFSVVTSTDANNTVCTEPPYKKTPTDAGDNYNTPVSDSLSSRPACRLVDEAPHAHPPCPVRTHQRASPVAGAQVASQRAAPIARDPLQVVGQELEHPHAACETGSEHEFDQYVDSIMDGLSPQSAISIPSDVTRRAPHDIPQSAAGFSDDDHNELLRDFLLSKPAGRHLILDSVCPDVAPHIVITPPSDPIGAYWAYCSNWTPPQSEGFLSVYPRQPIHAFEESPRTDNESFWNACEVEDTTSSTEAFNTTCYEKQRAQHPWAAFNHAIFQQTVEAAAQERLIFYHVVSAVHKRCFRLAAFEASRNATSFRTRWDTEDVATQFEKPYQWFDPAEPLLALYAQHRNARIFDSAEPFRAPHIVVHEAPEQAPWEIYQNCPPPQHCAGGYYLSAQPYGHSCPSCPPSPPLEFDGPSLLEVEPLEEESMPDVDFDEDDTESDSSLDTVEITEDSTSVPAEYPLDKHDPCLSFALDEDEDDLPPFDDWYQSIAQRTSTL